MNILFSYSKKKFEAILNKMVDCQLIIKVDNTEFDIPNNYILTPLGERIIIEKKEKTLKILNEILKTAFVALDVATKIGA